MGKVNIKKELEELYAELGGIGNRKARVVRGALELLELYTYADADRGGVIAAIADADAKDGSIQPAVRRRRRGQRVLTRIELTNAPICAKIPQTTRTPGDARQGTRHLGFPRC